MNPETNQAELIKGAAQGRRAELDAAIPNLYSSLHKIAKRHMSRESNCRILQTTAIVHEAYFRLADQTRSQWQDKNDFLAAASNIMRQILVDVSRKRTSQKRGGQAKAVEFHDDYLGVSDQGLSTVEIDDALNKLAEYSPLQAQAMEMILFAGLSNVQVAKSLGVSPSTIDRRIRFARAWLRGQLTEGENERE